MVAACSGHDTAGGRSGSPAPQPLLNTTTAADVVAALTKAGLPVTNAHDVAGSKCPQIGCIEAIDSEQVSVFKFPNTGAAERFAGSVIDVYQFEDLALVFTAATPVDKKDAYEQTAQRRVGP